MLYFVENLLGKDPLLDLVKECISDEYISKMGFGLKRLRPRFSGGFSEDSTESANSIKIGKPSAK
jgi:hypothetical protein